MTIDARHSTRRSATHWPLGFLQSLRAGRRRIPSLPTRALPIHHLRQCLNALPYVQQRNLHQLVLGRPVPEGTHIESHQIASPWHETVRQRALPAHVEPLLLERIGRDRYGRKHWLIPDAARAYARLRATAIAAGCALEIVSSFRAVADQRRILERKRRAGQSWAAILAVNAPPGYSEHHSGRALDFAVADQPVLTEAFEHTSEFAWLIAHASTFGFRLSYPRGNAYGYIYEPWHWYFDA